jgi:hypothetical protein
VISRESAIEIARARVISDGVMELEGRTVVAKLGDGYWHVSFPFEDTSTRGGEPHVRVDAANGSVTKVTYSQ